MPKYSAWHHKKGAGKPEHLLAARKILGELKNSLDISKNSTGVIRRTLDDGTMIEAYFHGKVPMTRITAPLPGKEVRRVYEMFAYISDLTTIFVVKLDSYETDDIDGATFVETKHEMTLIKTIPIDIGAGLVGVETDSKHNKVYVSSYNPSNALDRVIEIDAITNEVVTSFRPPGAYLEFRPFYMAVDEAAGNVFTASAYPDISGAPMWNLDASTGAFTAMPFSFPELIVDLVYNKKTGSIYSIVFDAITLATTLNVINKIGDGNYSQAEYSAQGSVTNSRVNADANGDKIFYTAQDSEPPYRGFIAVYDVKNNTQYAKINGGDPFHMTVSHKGDYCVVNDRSNEFLWVYEVAKMSGMTQHNINFVPDLDGVSRIIGIKTSEITQGNNAEVHFSPDSKRIYCTTVNGGVAGGFYFKCAGLSELSVVDQLEIPTAYNLKAFALLLMRKPHRILDN